jgi:ribosomal protein L7/L12
MSWYVIAVAVVVVALVLAGRRGESPASARGLAAPTPERIDEYLRMGRKIDAIKAYRILHRVDLKTAKDAVDARERELGR